MINDLKQIIGAKVKAARAESGMTQESLAELIDRTVETVSNIERSKTLPTLDTLQAIGTALGKPVKEFFEDETELTDKPKHRIEAELKLRELARSLSDKELQIALKQVEVLRRS